MFDRSSRVLIGSQGPHVLRAQTSFNFNEPDSGMLIMKIFLFHPKISSGRCNFATFPPIYHLPIVTYLIFLFGPASERATEGQNFQKVYGAPPYSVHRPKFTCPPEFWTSVNEQPLRYPLWLKLCPGRYGKISSYKVSMNHCTIFLHPD